MNCREALAQLGDLSVDGEQYVSAAELISHLKDCPECEQEWEEFKRMLFVASAMAQPLPSAQQTQQMWGVCLEKIVAKNERTRAAARNPFLQWFESQPRLGWAALGGAVAVFGGVWLMSPQANDAPRVAEVVTLPAPGHYENPPENAAALVNNHTAMAFDPFNDHVGSTLVSYSATAK